MAEVNDEGFGTFLPEPVVLPLVKGFAALRGGIENCRRDELELLLNWAENIFREIPLPAAFIPLLFVGVVDVPEKLGDLQNLVNVVRNRLLPDVRDGAVVLVSTTDFLRDNPDILAALREGEDCDNCDSTDCVLHPSRFATTSENDIEAELPSHLEDTLASLFEDDEDEEDLDEWESDDDSDDEEDW